MANKKLIEVALPLEAINEGCLQEKNPFLKKHPRSMHLWWARRPLASARAVIFSQLVDDPSAHPEIFPTEELQDEERRRLFKILENIVKWENIDDENILREAREEIKKSWRYTCESPEHINDPNYDPESMPGFHDPFAGGGGLPLEAQRLGLEAYASDLNPVATIINKAMIELPNKYTGRKPINPSATRFKETCSGADGLAEDVRYYGEWIKKEATKRIGHLYPKVVDSSGGKHNVIAWIWFRNVKCPNPACGCNMPLASTFDVSSKKGNEAWIHPEFDYEKKKIRYEVRYGKNTENISAKLGRGAKFKCIMCGETTTDEYIKTEALEGRMGEDLACVVAENGKGRLYLSPDAVQVAAADIPKPEIYPSEKLPYDPRNIWCVNYGVDTYDKLFSNRQLTALCTFCDLVDEARLQCIKDGADEEYAKAIALYLACGVSQLSRYSCTECGWNKTNENVAQVFGRQAIPMVWDYAEANTLEGSLSITSTIEWPASVIKDYGVKGRAVQADAQNQTISNGKIVSTDPPYYDNISYANLSDFFYVWLRRSLKGIYPELFATMLVPKAEELIASPYRQGSNEAAEEFFLNGMGEAMSRIAEQAHRDYPVTIYYAFKQSDVKNDAGISSTGWETFLEAVLRAGFTLTGTWPIRTERTKGLKGSVNALASSIVLVCRIRPSDAPTCTRRNFIKELKRELHPALQKLQKSNIAPVDLAQSAIGPGMGVFSKYSKVLEADGTKMTVRSALQIINQEIDVFFNKQDDELDRDSRFCVDMYSQFAFNDMKFGDADTLARAKNTSVESMNAKGILLAQKGNVHLLARDELAERSDNNEISWILCQRLTYAMETGGIEACAKIIAPMYGSEPEKAKDLAYRLHTIATNNNWYQEAYVYNALVVSWPEIQSRAATIQAIEPKQMSLFDLV